MVSWPQSFDELVTEQKRLAAVQPHPWTPPAGPYSTAGCFICFPRGQSGYGAKGDPAWVGAALITQDGLLFTAYLQGAAGARYEAGLLALREGPLLEAAVRSLPRRPELLLVNASGLDHPRRAGLALHLGALLDLPTIGVTHRPLAAGGEWPRAVRGAHAPLLLAGERVGYWVCTRDGTRPLAIHAGWRTDTDVALEVALAASSPAARTPEPIRQARRVARSARTAGGKADSRRR